MKIITRDKGISRYSQKKGIMTIDYDNKIFWLKMDVEKKGTTNEQYMVQLSEFEVAQVINAGLKDAEIIAACKRQRQDIIKDFLE